MHKAKTKQGGEYRTKEGKEVAIKTIRYAGQPLFKDQRLVANWDQNYGKEASCIGHDCTRQVSNIVQACICTLGYP